MSMLPPSLEAPREPAAEALKTPRDADVLETHARPEGRARATLLPLDMENPRLESGKACRLLGPSDPALGHWGDGLGMDGFPPQMSTEGRRDVEACLESGGKGWMVFLAMNDNGRILQLMLSTPEMRWTPLDDARIPTKDRTATSVVMGLVLINGDTLASMNLHNRHPNLPWIAKQEVLEYCHWLNGDMVSIVFEEADADGVWTRTDLDVAYTLDEAREKAAAMLDLPLSDLRIAD